MGGITRQRLAILVAINGILSTSAAQQIGTNYLERGLQNWRREDYEAAREDFTRAIENRGPDLSLAYLYRGQLQTNHEIQIADFTRVIELGGTNAATAYWWRGRIKGYNDDTNGQLADFDRAIELNPNFAEAYRSRGWNKAERKDYAGAISDFNRLSQLNSLDGAEALAGLSMSRERWAEAITNYTRVIQLGRRPYFSRGIARLNNYDFDGAIADLDQAIRLSPTNAGPYTFRAFVRLHQHRYDDAIANATRAIELFPQPLAYMVRAWGRYCQGDFPGAIEDCKAYREKVKTMGRGAWASETSALEGLEHFIDADFEKAVASWNKAVSLAPDIPFKAFLQSWIEKAKSRQATNPPSAVESPSRSPR